MFELSDNIEVTVITDIGIDRRSAVIIDNIYKSPEEVREFVSSRNKYDYSSDQEYEQLQFYNYSI